MVAAKAADEDEDADEVKDEDEAEDATVPIDANLETSQHWFNFEIVY